MCLTNDRRGAEQVKLEKQQLLVLSPLPPPPPQKKKRRRRKPQKPGLTAQKKQRHFVQHNYHDHAGDVDPADEQPSDSSSCGATNFPGGEAAGFLAPATFPLKLHALLDRTERDGLGHVVSWSPHGRAFRIHQPKVFVSRVLPKFFCQTKLTSFQRQLSLYGFERISRGPDEKAYYHERFLRGKPFLTKGMVRVRIKGTRFKAASCPDQEPDFYKMPPVKASSALCESHDDDDSSQEDDDDSAPSMNASSLRSVDKRSGESDGDAKADSLRSEVSPWTLPAVVTLPSVFGDGLINSCAVGSGPQRVSPDAQPSPQAAPSAAALLRQSICQQQTLGLRLVDILSLTAAQPQGILMNPFVPCCCYGINTAMHTAMPCQIPQAPNLSLLHGQGVLNLNAAHAASASSTLASGSGFSSPRDKSCQCPDCPKGVPSEQISAFIGEKSSTAPCSSPHPGKTSMMNTAKEETAPRQLRDEDESLFERIMVEIFSPHEKKTEDEKKTEEEPPSKPHHHQQQQRLGCISPAPVDFPGGGKESGDKHPTDELLSFAKKWAAPAEVDHQPDTINGATAAEHAGSGACRCHDLSAADLDLSPQSAIRDDTDLGVLLENLVDFEWLSPDLNPSA